jgi:hypothetical protein
VTVANTPACLECGQAPCTGPTLCYGDGVHYGHINNAKRAAMGMPPVAPLVLWLIDRAIINTERLFWWGVNRWNQRRWPFKGPHGS